MQMQNELIIQTTEVHRMDQSKEQKIRVDFKHIHKVQNKNSTSQSSKSESN